MTNYYRMGMVNAGNSMIVGGSGIAGTGVFADVPDEVNRLNGEVTGFDNELKAAITGQENSPLGSFYTSTWIPWLKSWKAFAEKHSHWYHNMFLSSWHDVNEYRDAFIRYHKAAQILGLNSSISPTPVREDAFQQAGDNISHLLSQVWHVVKVIIYAGVGVASVILVVKYLRK